MKVEIVFAYCEKSSCHFDNLLEVFCNLGPSLLLYDINFKDFPYISGLNFEFEVNEEKGGIIE